MENSSEEKFQDYTSSIADNVEGAKAKAQELASTAAGKARDITAKVGEQMKGLAGQVRDRSPQEGTFGTAAESVAKNLESAGAYLEEKDFGGMVEDLTALVRRYPMQSLLIGMGIGFLLARRSDR